MIIERTGVLPFAVCEEEGLTRAAIFLRHWSY